MRMPLFVFATLQAVLCNQPLKLLYLALLYDIECDGAVTPEAQEVFEKLFDAFILSMHIEAQ